MKAKAFAAKWNDDDTVVIIVAETREAAILAWWDWQKQEKNDDALYDEADDLDISASKLLAVEELESLSNNVYRYD